MKNVMTPCSTNFRKIFQIIYSACLITVTLLLTLYLVLQYMKNEDQSKLLYREFDDSPEGKYPMISICFQAVENLIDSSTSINNHINATEYQQAILGKKKDITNILRNYEFDNVTLKFQDYLLDTYIENLNYEKTYGLIFRKNYQDPLLICFSWNAKNVVSGLKLLLNLKKLKQIAVKTHEYYFTIHVTYEGQLIRNLVYIHKEDLFLLHNKTYNHIRVDLSGFSLMHLRPDAKRECNPIHQSDDIHWMNHVAEHIGCVPQYWTRFVQRPLLRECNSKSQYYNASRYLPMINRTGANMIFSMHKRPCNKMKITTGVKFLNFYREDVLKVDFRYLSNEYEEIKNVRDIGLENLVANIGGYVGMLLGVSLLQCSTFLITILQKSIAKRSRSSQTIVLSA